ncbi:hypothetical protein [Candidatus Leptofilum sp.]|uniref:hypothetical protein n=1 Tax=Candidatus Leptofilum sp. TaxID=3241576 RepID=UPI003B5C6ED6
MKKIVCVVLACSFFISACTNGNAALPPSEIRYPQLENSTAQANVAAQSTLTATPTHLLNPSSQPSPHINMLTSTPTAAPTWWSHPPATPSNDQVTPTPMPPIIFTNVTIPVNQNGIVIFDSERQERWEAASSPLPEWEVATNWGTDHDPVFATVSADFKPTQIRAQSPIILAPYVNESITIDGNFDNWQQVEYAIPGYDSSLTYQSCRLSGGAHFIWDNENLYLKFRLLLGEKVQLAFDSSLEEDFHNTEPYNDDTIIEVSVDNRGVLTIEIISNTNRNNFDIRTAVGQQTDENHPLYANTFPVEISFPLEFFGLATNSLQNLTPGWGIQSHEDYLFNPLSLRVYYPNVQGVIGFGIQSSCAASESSVLNPNDPTSWGTLVFSSDR